MIKKKILKNLRFSPLKIKKDYVFWLNLIKKKIVSQMELNIPTYSEKNLPSTLSAIKAVKPGSRTL